MAKKKMVQDNESDGKEKKRVYAHTLEDSELRSLMQNTYPMYSRHVFTILRAEELGLYYPFSKEKKEARQALYEVFAYPDFAHQVLDFYRECEANRRIFDDAENDPELLAALEYLRGVRKPPLMVDLPIEASYELWSRAGSWSGALTLAGLDSMNNRRRQYLVTQYILKNASTRMIPPEIRERLTPDILAEVGGVCRRFRNSGKYQTIEELPKKLKTKIQAAGSTPFDIFRYMGILLIKKEKKPQHSISKIQKFHERSYWWRHSKKYQALSRGEKSNEKSNEE